MSRFRYRDEESSTGSTVASVLLGAAAGFAVGMFVAQRSGGFDGIAARFRKKLQGDEDAGNKHYGLASAQYDEIEDELEDPAFASAIDDDDFNGMDADEEDDNGVPLLEERVLEAFNNDPILAERAVDIGAMGTGVIELAGWVDSDDEAEHAMTVARGVPGVETVVNRLMIDDEEQQIGENVRRFQEGDPALTEARWEGQQVGTGKRRQGRSDEMDRHADPKPELEDRWLSEREAIRNAADDIDEISAERRTKAAARKGKAARADEAEPTA
ncbi:MAG TPA: BON domain-containing protein [Gemmatimonadaceae bacterium]|nr:BON domain-containing protein [Gemmatimonadaceae bacterium]